MKMKNSLQAGLIINTIVCWTISAKSVAKDGEIEVKLQFLEYELEDFCVSKNEAEWTFLNGTDHDLKKYLDVELKESTFYKHELEVLQKHMGKQFSNKKLQRLIDVFSHPGAALLGNMEFKEYRDYTIKLQELIGTMEIECLENESTATTEEILLLNLSNSTEKCTPVHRRKIQKMLYTEKDEGKLKNLWTNWFKTVEEKNKKTKYDFVQQLSILDLEAEQNGEEELTEYWLKQIDTNWVNYETAKNLWAEIRPFYEKLRRFISSLVTQNFGKNILRENIIPAHVLGSLESDDWITAAEKLGAFEFSDVYKSIRHSLKQKKVIDIYKIADNQTAELKLGHLPLSFYEKSGFNVSSQTCQSKIMDYCERENVLRAMFCADEFPNIRHYIQINENVMRLKHRILSGKEEEENGYLFREGPIESGINISAVIGREERFLSWVPSTCRDFVSVLYEAMEGLSSVRALWPENLENQELLTNHSQEQKIMLSLLITALHVIPPLPYYLASDLWRINVLREVDATVGENEDTTSLPSFSSTSHSLVKREYENPKTEENVTDNAGNARETESNEREETKSYTTKSLTRDWWNFRQEYQGIGSPDGKFYEDYLQDEHIIWNKPYLSKFLGKILQFQILEKSGNLTADLSELQAVLQKGKSESWQYLVEATFNITEISTRPLLTYFKPLEEFIDKGIKLKNHTQLFSFDDLNFVSQGFSLNPPINEGEGEKPAEGSDALFFSLAAVAAIGLVAIIVTIRRRRYKRKQRERKRRLAEF